MIIKSITIDMEKSYYELEHELAEVIEENEKLKALVRDILEMLENKT